MAIWQFTFKLIPKEFIKYNFNEIPKTIDFEEIESKISWKTDLVLESSIKDLANILKIEKSWSNSIKQLGNLEETCVELFYENNSVVEISARLDLRNLSASTLDSIIEFINKNNCLILTENNNLLEASRKNIILQMKQSKAYSFVKNPVEFLDNIY